MPLAASEEREFDGGERRTNARTVRKIAAVLKIQYRQTADGEINQASVISMRTPQGEIAQQSSTL